MSYYFYLGDFQLPVPPPRMDIKVGNKNKTVSLINEGEINILKTPGLKEVSFEAMFPNQSYPFADYATSLTGMAVSALLGNSFAYQSASGFLSSLQTAKLANLPLRFIVTRLTANFTMLFDSNFLVSIEDFTMKEDAKNGYDIVVPLRLKEYRPYGTKEVTVSTDENGKETITVKESRQTDKLTEKAWTVTKEKSVFEAVKLASGGGLNWRSIANLNGVLNPSAVQPGQVLKLE
jgi:hypothetical protein|nr:MAG TPA: tail assembly protein [Siphoviridae sp. ct2ef27]